MHTTSMELTSNKWSLDMSSSEVALAAGSKRRLFVVHESNAQTANDKRPVVGAGNEARPCIDVLNTNSVTIVHVGAFARNSAGPGVK